jgi:hypothetical protein
MPEHDMELIVNGNIYTRDGSNPFLSSSGRYRSIVSMFKSNLVDTVTISSGGDTTVDTGAIAAAVWDHQITSSDNEGSFGWYIQKKILTIAKFLGLK